jgi:signal transduction histidine kinase
MAKSHPSPPFHTDRKTVCTTSRETAETARRTQSLRRQTLVSTAGGVAVIDPKTVRRDLPPPPVLIEEARIDQNETKTNVDEIRLEPDQSALEIDYTGLGFVGAERTRFRYRLEGLDENWTDAGTRRTAYFSHLPEGVYSFRVTAANQEGVWNPEGAAVKVVIVPPFYRKSWFYALMIIGVFGLVTFVYLSRVRRLQALNRSRAEFSRHLIESQESERRRIALELHDSLGQTLAVIRNRTMMGLNAKNFPQALEQFREISEASTHALRETREIAHNLHPAQIENLGLTTALRTLVKSVEGSTGIKCETDIEEVPASLSYEAAIVIYRISQETLTNIIRHSDASLVRFSLRIQEPRLVLTIEDDGRGFQEELITKGLGLNGIRERAMMIGGEISIVSQPGEGTRTTLTLVLDER